MSKKKIELTEKSKRRILLLNKEFRDTIQLIADALDVPDGYEYDPSAMAFVSPEKEPEKNDSPPTDDS